MWTPKPISTHESWFHSPPLLPMARCILELASYMDAMLFTYPYACGNRVIIVPDGYIVSSDTYVDV